MLVAAKEGYEGRRDPAWKEGGREGGREGGEGEGGRGEGGREGIFG